MTKQTTEQMWEQRRRRYAELKLLKLTPEEKARWAPMLHRVWQAIGGDVEAAMRYVPGAKLTKAVIVETVCDCNYLETYADMTSAEYEFLGAIYDRKSTQRWLRETLNY